MFNSKYVVSFLVVVLIGLVYSQRLAVGDACKSEKTNNQGACKLISDCPKAKEDLQKHMSPQICGFEGAQPMVCCEVEENTRAKENISAISKQKCKEYAKYAYEKVTSPHSPSNTQCEPSVSLEPTIKQFPHMALIGYEDTNETLWLCAGTIISEQYILTAAHCLNTRLYGPPKYIRMGVSGLNDDTIHKQEYTIAELIPHPKFKHPSFYNDIGLIKSEKPAKINQYVRPACLNTEPNINASRAIAMGWGSEEWDDSSTNKVLQKVMVDLVNYTYCNHSYKNQIGRRLANGIEDDSQLCAAIEIRDQCLDTSGGPLQIRHVGDDCTYDVIGVRSFGKVCGVEKVPEVYTRVSHYIEWVENIVWS